MSDFFLRLAERMPSFEAVPGSMVPWLILYCLFVMVMSAAVTAGFFRLYSHAFFAFALVLVLSRSLSIAVNNPNGVNEWGLFVWSLFAVASTVLFAWLLRRIVRRERYLDADR